MSYLNKVVSTRSKIYWSQVENRRTYNITSVRTCVRTYVRPLLTAYLKNRSKDFSETWYEVGAQ